MAAGISKYSTATWALSTYSDGNDYLDDDVFLNMLKEERSTGNHNRLESYCRLIAEAYFTTAQDMAAEIEAAGFWWKESMLWRAVSGSRRTWKNWERPDCRERLLETGASDRAGYRDDGHEPSFPHRREKRGMRTKMLDSIFFVDKLHL